MSRGPLGVAMHGATGRMGLRIIQLIAEAEDLALSAAIERPGHARMGEDVGPIAGLGPVGMPLVDRIDGPIDVLIDFSAPGASLAIASSCAERGIPLVVGTTGFEPGQRAELDRLTDRIPILVASNFSKAVNLLMHLVGEASRVLGDSADIEVVERHHRFKKDAPSGTALRLAEVAAEAIGTDRFVHGRHGQVGERPAGEIGLHALRTGDNPGEHTVVFGLMGECLELSHRALNRDGFARGALDAARFLAGKPPGRYSMEDLLRLGRG
ncbi:4-hydroxy-tetrahydrodipicolinate reductase [Tautonia plasticadhaerens]|uniref:4-hydroxy-tetrahydrodipicolinate reductase n=1 Tax=Tautonia plasticadhaerens TaxID=2527974 RepID=A0A518H0Z0_9BACT|nr:4-hydroxy-tetrahydrodipicolinate reductase [Tautonia plasticadhaerens]QDV34515.1 4-hydroxy-tetrahydrodipicolinate reductase [Tautonia plasticadhaerens]